jgi:hypothetical protein
MVIWEGAYMTNNEFDVERRAGIDMVPVGESFEWNPKPDDSAPILRDDFDLKVSEQGAVPLVVKF